MRVDPLEPRHVFPVELPLKERKVLRKVRGALARHLVRVRVRVGLGQGWG